MKEQKMKKPGKEINFQNNDNEKTILGSILYEKKLADLFFGDKRILSLNGKSSSLFFNPKHKEIFVAIKNIYQEKNTVDIMLVDEYLQNNNPKYSGTDKAELLNLDEFIISLDESHFKWKVDLLFTHATRRWIQKINFQANENLLTDSDYSSVVKEQIQAIEKIIEINKTENHDFSDKLLAFIETLENPKENQFTFQTPFGILNYLLNGGIKPGLYGIEAKRQSGKTTFVNNILKYVCDMTIKKDYKQQHCFITRDDSVEDIIKSILSNSTKISRSEMIPGETSFEVKDRILSCTQQDRMFEYPLLLEANLADVSDICQYLRVQHAKKPLGIVVIDYLGRLSNNRAGRVSQTEQLDSITNALKNLQQQTGCALFLLHQQTQEDDHFGSRKKTMMRNSTDSRGRYYKNLADACYFYLTMENKANDNITTDADQVEIIIRVIKNKALGKLASLKFLLHKNYATFVEIGYDNITE